jgi:pilus assembly protein CpaD
MGCAYQNMLAVQVANPRDIASPRGETPSDVRMRMRAIGKVRQGTDPGTAWKVQNSNIGSVGGN